MTPPDETAAAPRLLVLRALGLGDLCTAVPALRGLRRAFPRHRLVLAGPAALAPLAALSGAVDDDVDVPGLDRGRVPALPGRDDIAVNLHGRGPQSSRRLAATGAGRLVAFAHDAVAATAGGPGWDEDEHEVVRWCRLVGTSGATADPTDLRLDPPRPDGAVPPDPGVVVHPGAASPARRWPADRWAALVRALRAGGRRVTVTGGPDERPLAEEVVGAAGAGHDPGCTIAAGRTDVVGLAGLVAVADLLVAGDTGVAHLATAFATPSVLLFGPTPPDRWGPITDGPHSVLWAGRTGDPHGAAPDPGLLEISVPDVLGAVSALRPSAPTSGGGHAAAQPADAGAQPA